MMVATVRSGGDKTCGVDPTRADGIPEPPLGLTAKEVDAYRKVIGMIDHRILRRVDVVLLGGLARLMVEVDDLSAMIEKDPADNRSRRTRQAAIGQIGRLSALLYLSPHDRTRMKPAEQTDDPFEDWLEGATAE